MLIADEDHEGACNRAYYAMYDAAQAALESAGVPLTKTHSGLVAVFGQKLVQTGKLSPELGRALGRVMNIRAAADYDGDVVGSDDSAWALTEAETFIAAIEAALPIR